SEAAIILTVNPSSRSLMPDVSPTTPAPTTRALFMRRPILPAGVLHHIDQDLPCVFGGPRLSQESDTPAHNFRSGFDPDLKSEPVNGGHEGLICRNASVLRR